MILSSEGLFAPMFAQVSQKLSPDSDFLYIPK